MRTLSAHIRWLPLVAVMLTSCSKKHDDCVTCPTPATTVTSLSLTLNGTHWSMNPTPSDGGLVTVDASYDPGSGRLTVLGQATPNGYLLAGFKRIRMDVAIPMAAGTASLGALDIAPMHGAATIMDYDLDRYGETDSTHVGAISLTSVDSSSGWITAHFAFDAFDEPHAAVMHVTDGVLTAKLDGSTPADTPRRPVARPTP